MKAIRAVVRNGSVVLEAPFRKRGEFEAVVVVLDPDPWDSIVKDRRPRPNLTKARKEALAAFEAGKTVPLDPDATP